VVPHGEAAAKEWISLMAQRVEGWRSNGCLVELLNVSELEITGCILEYLRWKDSGNLERVSWEE
jgi:hypothetical protein